MGHARSWGGVFEPEAIPLVPVAAVRGVGGKRSPGVGALRQSYGEVPGGGLAAILGVPKCLKCLGRRLDRITDKIPPIARHLNASTGHKQEGTRKRGGPACSQDQ